MLTVTNMLTEKTYVTNLTQTKLVFNFFPWGEKKKKYK